MDAVYYSIFVLCVVATLMVATTRIDRKNAKRRVEAKKLDKTLYGVLSHRNGGVRMWITPFDLKQAHDAFHECVWGMQREAEVEYCTIFLRKNGGDPVPLWTVGRAPEDTLKPR